MGLSAVATDELRRLAAASVDAGTPLHVRVSQRGGRVLTGELDAISELGVSLGGTTAQEPYVPWSHITLLEIAEPNHNGEWLLLAAELAAGGLAVAAIALVPLLFEPTGMKVLAVSLFGALGGVHLFWHKRAREWFTTWRPMHE